MTFQRLTVLIFQRQSGLTELISSIQSVARHTAVSYTHLLWNNRASTYIYTEKRKTLVYALQQIQSGGVARTGQMAAVSVIVMIVPIIVFVLSQSQVLETMASSGIKE